MPDRKENEPIAFMKLHEDAIIPTRGTKYSAGLDLYALEDVCVEDDFRAVVRTGIAVRMPRGYYGQLTDRSSMADIHGLKLGAGTIDNDYTGEIKLIMFNHDVMPCHIEKGTRIGQMVVMPYSNAPVCTIECIESTERGDGGFGSTGMN